MFVLLLSLCGQVTFEVTNRCPQFTVVNKTQKQSDAIEVTLWTIPNCGPCATTKANIGAGDKEFSVTVKHETGPTYSHKAYPVLTAPGRAPLVGAQSKVAVRKWLGLK